MKSVNLRGVDLNLLPVLRELLRTRNVTRASENLNMSQSAVSEALKRMRHLFKDELLVRVGQNMVPTHFADILLPTVEQVLGQVEMIMLPAEFDPADLKREFVIATADSIALLIGEQLIRLASEIAPQVSFQIVDLQDLDVQDLRQGKIDLLIMPDIVDQSLRGLHSFHLHTDEFVCISRGDHPDTQGKLTKKDLERLPSVAFRSDQESELYISPHEHRPDQLRVPDFFMLVLLVETTDAIALIPRHIAERFVDAMNIRICKTVLPKERVDVHAYWADVHQNDPAHIWLREMVKSSHS